jgi:hypothetical protein
MTGDSTGGQITEELIGRMHNCSIRGIDALVSHLSESNRGGLAMFCYGRAHLYDAALAIAAACDLETLVFAGGHAGNHLFLQSRKRPEPSETIGESRRRKITLATNASRVLLDSELRRPMPADLVDEPEADDVAACA